MSVGSVNRHEYCCGWNKQSVGAFVREVLRKTEHDDGETTASDKLKTIEKSARYEFPVADMDKMLEEIDAGYVEEQIDTHRFEPSDVECDLISPGFGNWMPISVNGK